VILQSRKSALEEREALQRSIREQEAEVGVQRKAREEAERLLHAHQVKGQIEREAREGMHLETLRVILSFYGSIILFICKVRPTL
jgi:hypothetical protein